MKYCLILLTCAVLASGCIPQKPDAPEEITGDSQDVSNQPTQEQMARQLTSLLSDPDQYQATMEPYFLADKLAAKDQTGLIPILELLGAPDTTPATKIFILQVINVNMTGAYLPTLKSLLDSTDQVTRSCATNLIGSIKTDTAQKLLTTLRQDENSAVAFSAWSGLAQHGIEPHRAEFIQYYADLTISPARKAEIIRIILADPKPDGLPALSIAISDKKATLQLCTAAAKIFGEIGTLENIEPLQKSIENQPSEDYKTLAQSAIDLIRERSNG